MSSPDSQSFRPSRHRRQVLVVDWRDAEELAAWHMAKALSFHDVRITGPGADGGIDVLSTDAVAQVKYQDQPIGAPDIQNLRGAAHAHPHALFYSLNGYTLAAKRFANKSHCALFSYDVYGDVVAQNESALELLEKGNEASRRADDRVERGKEESEARYAELRAEGLDPRTRELPRERVLDHWNNVCSRASSLDALARALQEDIHAKDQLPSAMSYQVPKVREMASGLSVRSMQNARLFLAQQVSDLNEVTQTLVQRFEECNTIRGWYERLEALTASYGELRGVWDEIRVADPSMHPSSLIARILHVRPEKLLTKIEQRDEMERLRVQEEEDLRRQEAREEADRRRREAQEEADERRRVAEAGDIHRLLGELAAAHPDLALATEEDVIEELHRLRGIFTSLHSLAVTVAGRWGRAKGGALPELLMDQYLETHWLSIDTSVFKLSKVNRLKAVVERRARAAAIVETLQSFDRQI